MVEPGRPIFRTAAYDRYVERTNETVMPRFVSPRNFAVLWIVLALMIIAGVLAWTTPVPRFSSAPAVIVAASTVDPTAAPGALRMVLLLPPEVAAQVSAGQTLFVQGPGSGERAEHRVVSVDTQASGPVDIVQRLALGDAHGGAVTGPTVLALTDWTPPAGLAPATLRGSLLRVDVAVGSRRLVSLLPVVGRFFRSAP